MGGWAPTDDAAACTSATSGRWKNGSLTVLSSRSAPHPPGHLPPACLPADQAGHPRPGACRERVCAAQLHQQRQAQQAGDCGGRGAAVALAPSSSWPSPCTQAVISLLPARHMPPTAPCSTLPLTAPATAVFLLALLLLPRLSLLPSCSPLSGQFSCPGCKVTRRRSRRSWSHLAWHGGEQPLFL